MVVGLPHNVGDRYYDLAKFLHTLELSVETMESGTYELRRDDSNHLVTKHAVNDPLMKAREAFWDHVQQHNYNVNRIRLLSALTFINMAPLYDEQMANYLYFFGRYHLNRCQQKENG